MASRFPGAGPPPSRPAGATSRVPAAFALDHRRESFADDHRRRQRRGQRPGRRPGRAAGSPHGFDRRAWRQVLARVWNNIGAHHLSTVAAGVAFFGVLAIFPALAALVALYGLIADPADVMANLDADQAAAAARRLRPDRGARCRRCSRCRSRARRRLRRRDPLALWSARAGVSGLMEGLNIVYREIDTRSIIVQYLVSLALTADAARRRRGPCSPPWPCRRSCSSRLRCRSAPAWPRWVPLLILGFAVVFVIGALYRYGPHRETSPASAG